MRDTPRLFRRIDLAYNVDFSREKIFIENGARDLR